MFFQAGKLQVFDISSGALLETVDAHEGAVWSLTLAPDKVESTLMRRLYMKRKQIICIYELICRHCLHQEVATKM